jgi:carbohydrate-selective porin OprB
MTDPRPLNTNRRGIGWSSGALTVRTFEEIAAMDYGARVAGRLTVRPHLQYIVRRSARQHTQTHCH